MHVTKSASLFKSLFFTIGGLSFSADEITHSFVLLATLHTCKFDWEHALKEKVMLNGLLHGKLNTVTAMLFDEIKVWHNY